MSLKRVHKRVSASKVAALIVPIEGEKAIKDADLADLFGISVAQLYARIGGKIWQFRPRAFHKLVKAHQRGRMDVRPALAFTQAGVLLIAGILADDASLEIGMDIAHALKTRRRSSSHKERPIRRRKDPEKTARYEEAKKRLLKARLYASGRKVRH